VKNKLERVDQLYKVRASEIHGKGLVARVDLPPNTRVIEYKGLRRSHSDADRMYAESVEGGHTFLFTLNEHYLIDANFDGNAARWINHSCDPNCRAVLEEDIGGDRARDRIFIETIKAVRVGSEFTYNYEIRLAQPHTAKLKAIWRCLCGSKNCAGTMLQPKR
jgi:hypothetical protein